MKRIKDAIAGYMEKYGAEIAAGYLMMGGNLNAEAVRSLCRRAQVTCMKPHGLQKNKEKKKDNLWNEPEVILFLLRTCRSGSSLKDRELV